MRTACALAVTVTLIVSAGVAIADDRPPLSLSDDSRLQTKLDLKLVCEPLSVFADTLQKATGVKIRVRRDIADQNVTAFAKDITAAEAMASVSRVFGYKWECQDDIPEKRTYLLTRPQKKKIQAEETRKAEWRKADQQFKDGIENGIKMVDADASGWQKAFDKNPEQTTLNYMFRSAFQQLACFTKAQRDDIWDRIAADPNGEVRIPFAQFPPSLQKSWRDSAAESPERAGDIESETLIISRWGYRLPIRVRVGGDAGLGVASPNYAISGFQLDDLREAGVDTSSYKPPSPEFTDPEFKSKRVEIKCARTRKGSFAGSHSFADVLEAQSRMFNVNVFAPDYLCRRQNNNSWRTTFPSDPQEALDEISREFDYEAVLKGSTIGLRCKTWYDAEPYEVPKRLFVRWAEAKKKQGRLELKDYMDIAAKLDNMQIQGLRGATMDGDMPLMFEAIRMTRNADNLRLCSTFNPTQLKRAMGDGLSFTAMSLSQQQRFADLLRIAKPDLPADALANCVFSVSEETTVKDAKDDDTHQPIRMQEDYFYFTYTFAPGDEKRFRIFLDAERLKEEPPKDQAK